MEGLELQSFNIISHSGAARSLLIEAMVEARKNNMEEARKLLKEAEEIFVGAHRVHAEIIQKEAQGDKTEANLLLIHAEDQLMCAEIFSILADEWIQLYEIVHNK